MDRRNSRKKPSKSGYGVNRQSEKDDTVLAEKLPATITNIQTQARNSTRASVFLDGAFFRGFKSETLKKHGIKTGKQLTRELFHALIETDDRLRLREYILDRLASREHTVRELEEKVRRKKLSMSAFHDVISDLEEKGLLSEERYAIQFYQAKKNRGWGFIKIKSALIKKGVSQAKADLYLPEPNTAELLEAIRNQVKKNSRRFSRELDIFKRKKKIYDHLIRKGFPSGEIIKNLDDLVDLTD